MQHLKVTIQKLDNLFLPSTTLRPKLHTTSPQLLHNIHRSYHLQQKLLPIAQQCTPTVVPAATWSPIPPSYYKQEQDPEEDESLEDEQPPIIPPLHGWLQEQQQAAAAARQAGQNAIAAYVQPPLPPPPPPPPRQAKIAAIQAISNLGARPRQLPNIPQLEGAEPTPETSPETTLLFSHLSPKEPWSPIPAYSDFEESDFLPDDYDQWKDCPAWFNEHNQLWPSSSSIWSGEDVLSLAWDHPDQSDPVQSQTPLLQFIPDQEQHLYDEDNDSSNCIRGTRREVNANRRAFFGGFPVTPFPKRIKISQPDYSVWQPALVQL